MRGIVNILRGPSDKASWNHVESAEEVEKLRSQPVHARSPYEVDERGKLT
jgi:hypothetical protein